MLHEVIECDIVHPEIAEYKIMERLGCVTTVWLLELMYIGDSFNSLGRVTHICVSDLTIIGLDKGLSPGRRQAIIRTNAGILIIRPLEQTSVKF